MFQVMKKKALDNFCLKIDMCEDLENYILSICEGMCDLIEQGISRESFFKHKIVLSKLFRLGQDILEKAYKGSDLFFLGLFVDLKIHGSWFDKHFYRVISDFIKLVFEKGESIPKRIKLKILRLAREVVPHMYKELESALISKNSS